MLQIITCFDYALVIWHKQILIIISFHCMLILLDIPDCFIILEFKH